MGKTSNAVKDRWNAEAYDSLRIRIPKGRKAIVEAVAEARGMSVNGLVNGFLREAAGLSESDWKRTEAEEGADENA